MKDTSLKNTLFQAEFNTDLQLADIMRFIKERYDLAELLNEAGATPHKVVVELIEKEEVSIWDFMHFVSTEELEDEVRDRHLNGFPL